MLKPITPPHRSPWLESAEWMVRRRRVASEMHWAWEYIRTSTPLASPLAIAFELSADVQCVQAGFHIAHWPAFRDLLPRPAIIDTEQPADFERGRIKPGDVHREWQTLTHGYYPQFFIHKEIADGSDEHYWGTGRPDSPP